MIEHKLFIGFIVGLSLLAVASSINLELLSGLEYSLTGSESTKCDLVVTGGDIQLIPPPIRLILRGKVVLFETGIEIV